MGSLDWQQGMCAVYENPAVPISYFFHATQSSLWQQIRQCDLPEGGMRAQESERISEG